MIYFDIEEESLHNDQIKELLKFDSENQHQYYDHQVEGEYANLGILVVRGYNATESHPVVQDVVSRYKIKPQTVSIMRIKSGDEIVPHKDNPKYNRNTIIVYPLAFNPEDYAPCNVYKPQRIDIGYRPCYAFDTRTEHGVVNDTQKHRYQLQLWYPHPIEELFDLYKNKKFLSH